MSVTLYAVWRNYRKEWECVAVEAEENPNTYVIPRCEASGAFGYAARLYKDDWRACKTPEEAWNRAIEREESRVRSAEAEWQRAKQRLSDMKQARERLL